MMPKARFLVTAAIAEIGYRWGLVGCRWAGGCSKTHDRWVCHGPLRSPADAVVQRAFVCVVAAVRIGQEQRVDASPLQQFGELDPVL